MRRGEVGGSLTGIVECGDLTVFAIKKSASTQLTRAFHGTTHTLGAPAYLTAIRHPAHRLVSCYHHLVKPRYENSEGDHKYGPPLPFNEWANWVTEQDPGTANAHMKPQSVSLGEVRTGRPEGEIMMLQVEQLTLMSATYLSAWLGTSVKVEHESKVEYAPWAEHYTLPTLQRVLNYYRDDFDLWCGLDKGYRITCLTNV